MLRDSESVRGHYYQVYSNAFLRSYARAEKDFVSEIPKLIFYGVRIINGKQVIKRCDSFGAATQRYESCAEILELMKHLKPHEFVELFPVEKYYKGEKFGDKDYFYTMEHLRSLNQDMPIGENLMRFLFEYSNVDVKCFTVNLLCAVSSLRTHEGNLDMLEEFNALQGMDTPNTFRSSGKAFYIKNGRPKPLGVIGQSYLRRIK